MEILCLPIYILTWEQHSKTVREHFSIVKRKKWKKIKEKERTFVGKPACQGISFQSFGRFVSQQTVLFHLCGSVRAFSLTEIFLKIYELEHATVTCDSYSFSILRVMLLLLLRCATFFLSFFFIWTGNELSERAGENVTDWGRLRPLAGAEQKDDGECRPLLFFPRCQKLPGDRHQHHASAGP